MSPDVVGFHLPEATDRQQDHWSGILGLIVQEHLRMQDYGSLEPESTSLFILCRKLFLFLFALFLCIYIVQTELDAQVQNM